MNQESKIPEPDYEDPKEIYAFFGLTFYKANVLEHGVLNLTVALQAKNVPGVTVGDVNNLYESFDNQTFGRVISVAKKHFNFSDSFSDDLNIALNQRNYLAHRFFIDHDIDMLTDSGRRDMIDELIEILKHLRKVDSEMDEKWLSAWEYLGITKEWIEKEMQKYVEHRRENDA